jgi:hypothetical protein
MSIGLSTGVRVIALCAALVPAFSLRAQQVSKPAPFDIVIQNGRIID